jgi:hypothetical protein
MYMYMYFTQLLKQKGKRCQKRPTTVSKETYYSVKRDLLQCSSEKARGRHVDFLDLIKSKDVLWFDQIKGRPP